MGIQISETYVRQLKMQIKNDCGKELALLQKDRVYYIQQLFFQRVGELEFQQKVLHEVIDNNKESNSDVVVRAVNVLHNITSSIYQEYVNLPIFSGFRFPPIPLEPEPLGPSSQRPQEPYPTDPEQNNKKKEPVL
jgi:aspartate/glutamate racemase